MIELVHNLQKALGQRVEALSWMSPETKKRAQEKLSSFVIKIGYPDKWMDYSALDIDESKTYYQNLEAATRFMQADNLKDLGKPVDRTKWLMSLRKSMLTICPRLTRSASPQVSCSLPSSIWMRMTP